MLRADPSPLPIYSTSIPLGGKFRQLAVPVVKFNCTIRRSLEEVIREGMDCW